MVSQAQFDEMQRQDLELAKFVLTDAGKIAVRTKIGVGEPTMIDRGNGKTYRIYFENNILKYEEVV